MYLPSQGSILSCAIFGSILMLYLIILSKYTSHIFRYGTGMILSFMFLLMVRMFLPYKFIFTQNVPSYKILPFFLQILNYPFGKGFTLEHLILFLWVTGIFYNLIKLWTEYWDFSNFISLCTPCHSKEIQEILDVIAKNHLHPVTFHVVKSRHIKTPCITGFFHPVILLPDIPFRKEELRFILYHETTHYYHHDLWFLLLSELIICLYWWNPLAYMIHKQLHETLEYSDDLAITKNFSENEKLNYMEFLLNSTRTGKTPAVLKKTTEHSLKNGSHLLKNRTKLMLNHKSCYKKKPAYYGHILVLSCILLASIIFVFEPANPVAAKAILQLIS